MKNNNLLAFLGILILVLTGCEKTEEKPVLRIVEPQDELLISYGENIDIVVNANDPDGIIESVEFFVNNNLIHKSISEPYNYSWNTEGADVGINVIKAIATDNDGYKDSTSVNVEICSEVPSIKTLPVKSIGVQSVTCGIQVTDLGNPRMKTKGICFNETGNPTISDSVKFDIQGGEISLDGKTRPYTDPFDVVITGLKANTIYFMKAFIQNDIGVYYGEEISFTTHNQYWSETGDFMDERDQTSYKWIKIGDQIWMAENLRYEPIGYNNQEDIEKYGGLYPLSSSICPAGWHIPSNKEWQELIIYLGGANAAGGHLKQDGIMNWQEPNSGATNYSKFNALPGGRVRSEDPNVLNAESIGNSAFFWSSGGSDDFYTGNKVNYIVLNNDLQGVSFRYENPTYPFNYMSIRCVKD